LSQFSIVTVRAGRSVAIKLRKRFFELPQGPTYSLLFWMRTNTRIVGCLYWLLFVNLLQRITEIVDNLLERTLDERKAWMDWSI
jgi:hypothetical protein